MSDSPRSATPNDTLGEAIRYLGRLLDLSRDEGGLSRGDRAELRRMDPRGVALPPAFWRLLATRDVTAAIPGGDREPAERAASVMIQAMAEASAMAKASRERITSIGAALAASGYAEQRFVRLLRARGLADVAHEARLAAQWCSVKDVRPYFADRRRNDGFGPFILDATLERASADHRAHAIARDYFGQISRDERDTATPEPAQ